MRLPIASSILFFLLPLASAAQVYSWKDASGKVHYGDRPPAERQTQVRQLPGAPAVTPDVEAARKAAAERKFVEREKQVKEEGSQIAEDRAQAKIRAENCQRAKNTLAALESGEIRFALNEKGERIALDGATREAELSRARKSVADWCSPPAAPVSASQ
ncbi:MAG: DUF4124 domain-containing protein [Rhodocyclaceae bacterium]